MRVRFGVVVVNWNTRDYLRSCLHGLRAQQDAPASQVVVVDNASADGSAEMTAQEFPEVTLLAEATNHGYAKGNNIGAKACDAEWLLLLNPDVRLVEDALWQLDVFISEHADAVAVGGMLMNPDGSAQHSVRGLPTYGSLFLETTGLARLCSCWDRYFLRRFDYSRAQKVKQPMGALLALRSDKFAQMGMFDERFPIFFNDVQLCRDLLHSGEGIYYTPSVRGYHEGGAGTRQVKPRMIVESHKSLIDYLRNGRKGHFVLVTAASELMIRLSCYAKTRVWLAESEQRIHKGGTGS
ncbi:MAG: glycosyltransferase family 2 protein [Armatimonadota bacterium]